MTNPKRKTERFELEHLFEKLLDEGYPEILFEDLLEGKTQRTADGILACCPFHDDNNPSFSVSFTKPVYYCFGCGETGSWITYLEKTRGMNFYQAINFLANEAGMELNKNYEKKLKEISMIQEILSAANEFYKANLKTTKEIDLNGYIEYRGFTSDTIERFQIGYAPSGGKTLYNHLKGLGYKDEDIVKTGLFTFQDDDIEDFFHGRIMYPYLRFNNPVYFIGGITDATPSWDNHKYIKQQVFSSSREYISSEINNNTFYGEDMILNADAVIITEGITDCITLNQNGYASISPATVKFKKDNIEKLAGLCKGKDVYFCNDIESNNAGFNGAKETALELLKYRIKAKIIMLPEPSTIPGYEEDKIDVNEYFKHFSKADFEELRLNSKNIIDMEIDNLLTPNCDSIFVEKAIKNLPNLNELEQDMYINIIQDKTGYRKAILKDMLDKLIASQQKQLEQQEVISEIILTPEEEADAIKKLSSPTLMYEIGQVLERFGIAGEEKNKRLLYLIFTTRKMPSACYNQFSSQKVLLANLIWFQKYWNYSQKRNGQRLVTYHQKVYTIWAKMTFSIKSFISQKCMGCLIQITP